MQPGRILVVDDDATAQELFRSILEYEGYIVEEAYDGLSGLEKFRELKPDAVLLDLQLPKMSGYEVLKEIKKSGEFIPVIVVTALGDSIDRVVCKEYGCDDFINKPPQAQELIARVNNLVKLKRLIESLDGVEEVLYTLARAVEAKDPFTRGHAERVSKYCVILGREMGLNDEDVQILRIGGLLHDVGKIAVPDSVLLKPGPLTPEEWVKMKRHPVEGVEICRALKTVKPALHLIRHHHERLDGTGYPDGLKKDEIPVSVRILTIVDIYDALTSRRVYKDAWPKAKALLVMREECERGWWDIEILKIWEKLTNRLD